MVLCLKHIELMCFINKIARIVVMSLFVRDTTSETSEMGAVFQTQPFLWPYADIRSIQE